MTIEAYPLYWPPNWRRTTRPESSRFKTTFSDTCHGLIYELELLGAKNIIISTNVPLRRDGLPYASAKAPADTGVAVYFELDDNDQCIPCDKWNRVADNLHAVELTVKALRGLERWGAKEMVNAAFRGFKALSGSIKRQWYEVLEVSMTATQEEIRVAYKSLAHERHPDKGGSAEAFNELQKAYKEGLGQI